MFRDLDRIWNIATVTWPSKRLPISVWMFRLETTLAGALND
jgi:hypothetical protein